MEAHTGTAADIGQSAWPSHGRAQQLQAYRTIQNSNNKTRQGFIYYIYL